MNAQDERLDLLVAGAAYRCRRRWGHMEYADLRSELYVWLYENPTKVRDLLAAEDTERADRDLTSSLLNAGERVARRERAELHGYRPEDEFFYSTAMLRGLLPDVYVPDAWVTSQQSDSERVSGAAPAREGNGRVAMLADISRALGQLREHDRLVLLDRYGPDAPEDEARCAERLEITQEALRAKVNRATGRLRRILGGRRPDGGGSERQYVGSRRALSNAAALAITNHQEDQ